jgi:hypothetical protein
VSSSAIASSNACFARWHALQIPQQPKPLDQTPDQSPMKTILPNQDRFWPIEMIPKDMVTKELTARVNSESHSKTQRNSMQGRA